MMLTALLYFLVAVSFADPLRVVLDAGHGGRDSGASHANVKESEITLAVCKRLEKIIKTNQDFEVLLTRSFDQYKSLPRRAIDANRFHGDLFISIHANASRDQRAQGVEIYFQNQLPAEEEALFLAAKENEKDPNDNLSNLRLFDFSNYPYRLPNNDTVNIIEDLARQTRLLLSRKLAETLWYNWNAKGKAYKKSLRQAPFYLFSNLNMPAALIEIGFLTNQREAKELSNPEYHEKVAQNLFNGIKSFKEYMDKLKAKDLN